MEPKTRKICEAIVTGAFAVLTREVIRVSVENLATEMPRLEKMAERAKQKGVITEEEELAIVITTSWLRMEEILRWKAITAEELKLRQAEQKLLQKKVGMRPPEARLTGGKEQKGGKGLPWPWDIINPKLPGGQLTGDAK